MRFRSSLVIAALSLPVAFVSPARAEQHPIEKARPEGASPTDLRAALESFRDALRLLDRRWPRGSPDVIRPDPELDRGMERRPPNIGAAMPTIVPRDRP